jgi:hypothetical protein
MYLLNRLNDPYVFRNSTGLSIRRLLTKKLRIIVSSGINYLIQLVKFRRAFAGTKLSTRDFSQRKAIVIANGPTRDTLNFVALGRWVQEKNLDIFAVNFGLKQLLEMGVPPKYLLLSDPETSSLSSSAISKELWSDIRSNPLISLITPVTWHSILNCRDTFPEKCLHFSDISSEGVFKNVSPFKPRSYSSLSGLKALAYSLFLGYGEVFVIGLDNSYFKSLQVGPKGEILQGSSYFNGNFQHTQNLSHLYKKGLVDYFAELGSIHETTKRCFYNHPILNLGVASEMDCFKKVTASDEAFQLISHTNLEVKGI